MACVAQWNGHWTVLAHLHVRVDAIIELRGEPGVEEDDVRHARARLPYEHIALQPREPAGLLHAHEHVARVQVGVDEVVNHQHLEVRLHAHQRHLLAQLDVVAVARAVRIAARAAARAAV